MTRTDPLPIFPDLQPNAPPSQQETLRLSQIAYQHPRRLSRNRWGRDDSRDKSCSSSAFTNFANCSAGQTYASLSGARKPKAFPFFITSTPPFRTRRGLGSFPSAPTRTTGKCNPHSHCLTRPHRKIFYPPLPPDQRELSIENEISVLNPMNIYVPISKSRRRLPFVPMTSTVPYYLLVVDSPPY